MSTITFSFSDFAKGNRHAVSCVKELYRIAQSAMELARQQQGQPVTPRADGDIITPGDLSASEYYQAECAKLGALLPDSYFYLDEEIAKAQGILPTDRRISTARFLFVVDPIDGSKKYAEGSPAFATSVALYEYGIPSVAVVVTNEGICLYLDGHGVFQQQVDTHGNITFLRLLPLHVNRGSVAQSPAVMHSANAELRRRLALKDPLRDPDVYACVLRMLGLVPLGNKLPQACASTHVDKFWDIAAMWPILDVLNVHLFNIEATVGGHIERAQGHSPVLNRGRFQDNWRLNGIHLACQQKNLKSLLTEVFEPLAPAT